jgi:uncharacterized protein (DUF488 family)
MHTLYTIGYENTTVRRFLEALTEAGIELLVDVRAVASSRRPGFAKSRLAANLSEAGIDYVHLRDLGTPADGRVAARAGRHAEMRAIFMEHLATSRAQDGLEDLAELVRAGRPLCLLCLEENAEHCHRRMVAEALAERMPLRIVHLRPDSE